MGVQHLFQRWILGLSKNAWMDKYLMKAWVEQILKQHVSNKPDEIVLILLLDMNCCHMMESVVSVITQLGVEVLHIPGGCMGLC